MNVKKDISPKGDDGKFYITPTNKSYFCPTPGSITIMALTPNRIGSVPDQQLFKDLSDCGFNAAAIWYNRVLPAQSGACAQIDTALTNCGNSEISIFFYTSMLQDNSPLSNAMVANYAKKAPKHFGGWYLQTPSYADIPQTATVYKAIWHKMRNDTTGNPASTQIIYMSAFARGEDAGSNYRDYLMKYQEMV